MQTVVLALAHGYVLKELDSELAADHEDQVRRLVRKTLGQAGYDVQDAHDGKEGPAWYWGKPADLIIVDA